jgi:hypothetical protein
VYHLLTEGRASARLKDGERVSLQAGDMVMIPHGDPHIVDLDADPSGRSVAADILVREKPDDEDEEDDGKEEDDEDNEDDAGYSE